MTHSIVIQLECLLADLHTQAATRETNLLRQVKALEKSAANTAKQRDKYKGKTAEYRAQAAKYRKELIEARRMLRQNATSH